MSRIRLLAYLILLVGCGGCSNEPLPATPASIPSTGPLDAIATDYVRLVLAVGELDPGYVDAYYGPDELRRPVAGLADTVPQAFDAAQKLIASLDRQDEPAEELGALRYRYLRTQLGALAARMAMLSGERLSFDQETQALYDATAPRHSAEHFQAILDQIDRLVPGDGPLSERVEVFRQGFVIPGDRLDAVFQAAITECRRRTLEHMDLPAGERFRVEYVTDKPWSGYNWYQGNGYSLIQINTDLPIFIERAVDLGCHEGYPGHHSYNALLEAHLVKERGWVEFSVYPLYSPQSLIAEGSANLGIELAFPGHQRATFEQNVLFGLAGLDPSQAERYYELHELVGKLNYAGNEAARNYLNGRISRQEAAAWLVQYGLNSPERAAQRVAFIDTYRGYVINYNLGKDLVRGYLDARAGDDQDRRWEVFRQLLSSPRLPSDLRD